MPQETRLYAGDAVAILSTGSTALRKGADYHALLEDQVSGGRRRLRIVAVVEVKSYRPPSEILNAQLDKHIRRAAVGLRIGTASYPADLVRLGVSKDGRVVRIAVIPSTWRLPRTFRFKTSAERRQILVDPGVPPLKGDRIERVSPDEWRVTLRWSMEALSEAAFEMTFWYMGKVGTAIYSPETMPREWVGMTGAEAGRNAIKMALYYAIPRCRSAHERQRAIALYNVYCFGYALGMHFKNARGRREMLWAEDLDQVMLDGRTDSGCRIVK